MKSLLILIGLLVFVGIAGCPAGDLAPLKTGKTQEGSVTVDPVDLPTIPSTTPSTGQGIDKTPAKVPAEPVKRKDRSAPTIQSTTPSTGQGINTPPAKVPAEPVRKKDSVTPADRKQASSLDLPSLEKRLRETKAIGLFTKITLKNQVDDLVNQFREYHGRPEKASLAELRQRYDMLLLKLLSLLQDSDPPLAHTIVASRDTIWSMLTDPDKFTTI
jgi:hypothetical protein